MLFFLRTRKRKVKFWVDYSTYLEFRNVLTGASGREKKYVYFNRGSRHFHLHRYLMGAKKGEYVDHISGNTLDNRRRNLRKCTNQQNCANGKKPKSNTSGFKGVMRKRKKWIARVKVNYRNISLGAYSSAEVAARIYDKAAIKYFGEFARLNFPEDKETAPMFVPPRISLVSSRNRTGYFGVNVAEKGFVASVRIKRKLHYFGAYPTRFRAAMVYDRGVKFLLGKKAKLNFPNLWQ